MKLRDLPRFHLSPSLEEIITWGLAQEDYSLEQNKALAQAILRLSDTYNSRQADGSLWSTKENRAAYWAYFLPWNFLRLKAVIEEGIRLQFFAGIDQVVDFGSGPGTAHLVWDSLGQKLPQVEFFSVETSKLAQQIHLSWNQHFKPQTQLNSQIGSQLPTAPSPQSLALFSYSLNETTGLPKNLSSYSHLLIIEPSTRKLGRQLMGWRQELIDLGFSLWAPCPHQLKCPLLEDSKHDWCHDRILIDRPDWMLKLEQSLPMENKSLTFSYLLASKQTPTDQQNLARIIGDTKKEKGKTRQAICRGESREFLAWLKKEGKAPLLARGSLVALPSELIKKGNEIRLKEELQVLSSHGS